MSKLSFAFKAILMILAVILAAGVITLIVISLIPTIGFGAKSILFTMIVLVLGLILIVKTVDRRGIPCSGKLFERKPHSGSAKPHCENFCDTTVA
ncbi:MAG: hypothetical protein WBE53_05930, partial [Pseudolabrys sp.]